MLRFQLSAIAIAVGLTGCGAVQDKIAQLSGQSNSAGLLTIKGTSATGAAIAFKTVDIQCKTGAGSTMTGADGTYSLMMNPAELPCVLRVAAPAGGYLYSVAQGSGLSAVSNITPLTNMQVAALSGMTPESFFNSFSSQSSLVTAVAVQAAQAKVASALKDSIDLTNVDPIRDVLDAATGTKVGNAMDQKLDALARSLTIAGTTVSDVSSALAYAGPSAVPFMLRAPAADCAGLRTGNYNFVGGAGSISGSFNTRVDAPALTISSAGKTNQGAKLASCKYAFDGGQTIARVTAAGFVLVTGADKGGVQRMAIGVPEQTFSMSDFVGNWTFMSFLSTGAGQPVSWQRISVSVDAVGQVTGAVCQDVSNTMALSSGCASSNVMGALTATGNSLTYLASGSQAPLQVLGHKGVGGQMLLVMSTPSSMVIGTKVASTSLPLVGALSRITEVMLDGAVTVVSEKDFDVKVQSVSSTPKTATITRAPDSRQFVYQFDTPRSGLQFRPAVYTADGDGSPMMVVDDSLRVPLTGFGATLFAKPTTDASGMRFGLEIERAN